MKVLEDRAAPTWIELRESNTNGGTRLRYVFDILAGKVTQEVDVITGKCRVPAETRALVQPDSQQLAMEAR